MKTILLSLLALSLPLTQIARADNDNDRRRRHRSSDDDNRPSQSAPANRSAQPTQKRVGQPSLRRPAQQQRPTVSTQRRALPTQRRTVPAQRNVIPTRRSVIRNPRSISPVQNRNKVRTEPELDGRTSGTRSSDVVRRNRGNRHVDRNSFDAARRRVIRNRHDRNWWRNRFNTTFVLFGGGYYYWDTGYWYPAYGYSPIYNNYSYSEPIYGYDNLSPGEVIENVQLALRDEGYDPGAIDGLMGPQTRSALAAYQQDHGLVITEAVDEPTLVALGLA